MSHSGVPVLDRWKSHRCLAGLSHSKQVQQAHETTSQQVIALGEVVERSKDSGKHKEAERDAQAQEESENKVCIAVTAMCYAILPLVLDYQR